MEGKTYSVHVTIQTFALLKTNKQAHVTEGKLTTGDWVMHVGCWVRAAAGGGVVMASRWDIYRTRRHRQ